MRGRRLAGSAGILVAVALLVLAFLPSIAGAATQVTLSWDVDAAGNPILPGQVIDDEYHSPTGISVTVASVNSLHNIAATFPSNDPPPTNGVVLDPDLGSPNETCPGGGPGVGIGGEVGQPGENCADHQNILIMPTTGDSNGDGFIDGVPNDDKGGGIIRLTFNMPVTVNEIEILDQETSESLDIRVYGDLAGTNLLADLSPAGLGDNSLDRVSGNVENARRVDFDFAGSGAFDNFVFTVPNGTAVSLAGVNISGTTPLYLLVLAALVLLLTGASLWLNRKQQV